MSLTPSTVAGVVEQHVVIEQVQQRWIKEEGNMNWVKWLRVSLMLMLALGLAIPALAQVQLNDSQEPGSVIVFPKFITGKTSSGEPRSEFEISVVCPKNPDGTPGTCPEKQSVKLRVHWVCPADQDFEDKFICQETDFDLFTTAFGTITF